MLYAICYMLYAILINKIDTDVHVIVRCTFSIK